MCVQHIPSPNENARTKVENIYTGPLDTALVQDMFNCNPDVRINIQKEERDYNTIIFIFLTRVT